MIQPVTHTKSYWEDEFTFTDSDIDQIHNHFIEVEKPQTTDDVVRAVMNYRIAAEKNDLMRRVAGRKLYEPSLSYAAGDELVFPLMDFAHGTVESLRDGVNPDAGEFQVLAVKMGSKVREFSAALSIDHPANLGESGLDAIVASASFDELYANFQPIVEPKVVSLLEDHDDFVVLGGRWFVKALLADVNIGHLHLAEAVLDMSGGGPLSTEEIGTHLDLEDGLDNETQQFSLNYALLNDNRFDEVAPKNNVLWFLRRMEPKDVLVTPERLEYEPIAYDGALLSNQLKLIEREIADEWSDLEVNDAVSDTITFAINYPHRVLGTMPLNTTMRKLLPLGRSPRQSFVFRDVETNKDIPVWVVKDGRYIVGLGDWYKSNEILVGGYVTLKPSEDDPRILMLDYQRKRPQREDVRLATVADGRIRFEYQRRRIGCEYDELMVVGTDYTAAIDTIYERAKSRSLASLMAALLPELAELSPQNAVHAKTLYSVLNMVRRTPPGPLFAELVRNPAFVPVGEHYWRFDPRRMQRD